MQVIYSALMPPWPNYIIWHRHTLQMFPDHSGPRLGLEKNNCLIVLHNFFGIGAGGQIFFFKIKVKSPGQIYMEL